MCIFSIIKFKFIDTGCYTVSWCIMYIKLWSQYSCASFPNHIFYQYQSWWNINFYWFAGKFTSEALHSLMEKTMGFRLRFSLSFQSIDDSSNRPKSSKSPGWQVGKTNRPKRPHVVMEWWPGEFDAETGRNFQSYHKTYIDFNFFFRDNDP